MKVALLTTDAREHKKEYRKPEPYFGTAPEALIEGFKELGSAVEVHVISCLQERPVASPDKLGDNVSFHPLHVPKLGWMRTGYQGCVRAVRRKISELRPDIVHGQGTERDCGISAVLSGLPNVLTIHGNMAAIAEFFNARPLSFYWLAARLERYCLRRTSGVVCISRYTRDKVLPYTRRTWLLPNAVHPSFFGVRQAPARPPRVVCVANIDARKNQIQLIKALESLQAGTQLQLRFIGAGSDENPYFRRFQAEVGSRPWCSYLGSLGRPAIQSELSAASIAVLPSLEDNCPMVILEAAAAGIPMAASRVGGIPDLVENGATGMLFDPASLDEMCDAVAGLLANPERAGEIAARSRNAAVTHYAPATIARAHLEIYREVLRTDP